jgi:hypothetical protein
LFAIVMPPKFISVLLMDIQLTRRRG